MTKTFRHTAAFGKRIEFYLVGLMLKEGLDVYLPLVDDDAIDAVIKRSDGSFVEVQIKARSSHVKMGDAALFAGLKHEHRKNYWFVFYSERLKATWILSSREFIEESNQNRNGKNIGNRSIWFNGNSVKKGGEYAYPKFDKYLVTDFKRLIDENPDAEK